MADLSKAATGDFAVEQMLRSLCDVAADALDVDGAGVMIRENGLNRFIHATLADVEPLEMLQEVLQQGPCAECLEIMQPVVVDDLARSAGWNEFRKVSSEVNLGSVLAMPLLSRGRGWGVLDLYRRAAGPWTGRELHAAQALADIAVSYVVMAHDRDDARQAQQTLAHQAMHDGLTGLPNRALLFDRLDHALAGARRRGAGVAVVFLDLDLFKSVNDTFGHSTADAVLVEVAKRLEVTQRSGDTLGRLAGDEFVLVCEGLPQAPVYVLVERVRSLTNRLQKALSAPIRIGGADVTISASIGVAITADPMSAQELISEADTAMYAAKQAGRGRVVVRDHTSTSAVGYARQLEHDLAGALERHELAVYYQPIFDARSGDIQAAEALLRWHQPQDGTLPAAAFIDIAVRSGLITKIGRWVIEQACGQMALWQRQRSASTPEAVFINLSARELLDPTLSAHITSTLEVNGLSPAQLGLEIVEQDLADPDIIERLDRYRRRGHPLSLDDFGTGYSSLSRLLDMPINFAKLDKSFVDGIPADTRRTRLIESILLMAGSLDILVVAEGVENAEQTTYLKAAGCHLMQGHYLAMPRPGQAFAED